MIIFRIKIKQLLPIINIMVNLPEIPKSKTLGFLFLGIVLYLGSTYLNMLKPDSAIIGIAFGIGLIIIGMFAQINNWIIYWNKKSRDY